MAAVVVMVVVGGVAVCREGGGSVEGFSLLAGEGADAGRWLTYCPELTRVQNNNWKVEPDFSASAHTLHH